MSGRTVSISNLLEALTLYLSGCKIQSVQPSQRSKQVFLFIHDENLDKYRERFAKGEIKMTPEQFLKGMREFSRVCNVDFERWK